MTRVGIAVAAALALIAGCGGGASSGGPGVAGTHPPSPSQSPAGPAQHFIVVASAYQSVPQDSFGGDSGPQYVEYVTQIRNPNLTYYCYLPQFDITAYGPHGRVLGTDNQILDDLPPGLTVSWAGQLDVPTKPRKVKITYAGQHCNPTVTKSADYVPFATKGVHLNRSVSGDTVTGTVRNPYDMKFAEMALTALFYRHQRLVGGATDFLDHLPAHSARPFSINGVTNPPRGVTRMAVQAQPWSDFGRQAKWNLAVYRAEGH